jgi:hypothetical protein
MGNICSTSDESDLRDNDKNGNTSQSDTSSTATKSQKQKNVFKANPKGNL